ncbi:MAG: hypothetical protein JXB29_01880 [Sedimentisphaerales bacterium]|nr:hypothetical protein [Sedimentisphaerales bacterium]
MQLLWKEWRQQKWLILVGSLAGITLPIFEWLNNSKFKPQINNTETGSIAVLICGVLFAIILSAASTHHDLKKGTDNFWQSRPLTTHKLFITKFLIAAILLFLAFLFVQSIDFVTHSRQDSFPTLARAALTYTYPIALIAFSLTMFLIAIMRDTAKAVLLAIWAALLIYFLPLLTNTLHWLNIFEVMDQPSMTLSIIDYLIWLTSLPENIGHGVSINRPAWMPHNFYQVIDSKVQVSNAKNLWYIITSPEYLRYLLFVTFTAIASALCIFLTVKAIKNNWRWRPEQKTIAWTLGLSAAFIFAVAMLQAGHNLGIVRTHNNREIISIISLWEKTENKYNWTGETIGDDQIHRRTGGQTTTYIKDDLMFRISIGSQINTDPNGPRLNWKTPLKQHFFFDIYRFPYTKEGFHLSETRFFVTNPIARNYPQFIFGSFVRNDRLYAAYRPQSPEQQKDRRIYENPLHFLTVDVSNPNEPKRISDTEISQPKSWNGTMTNYNEYCYINDGDRLLILSVAERDKPEIIGQVDLDLNWPKFPDRQICVIEDKLICNDRWQIAIFDLAKPPEPKLVFYEAFKEKEEGNREEYIGAITYKQGIVYAAKKSGIFVYKLTEDENGNLTSEMIGHRRATPVERLAGRQLPERLILINDMLVESANFFGVLVYDVSDPTRPRRAYHGENLSYTTDIGIWNELLYMVDHSNQLIFLEIPKAN